MMRERLDAYRNKTGHLPQHILFYRDGVSESQFGMVRKEELPQIIEACKEAGRTDIMITLVIVTKRHNARFYSGILKDGRKDDCNLRSGLFVNDGIVAPKQFNFYLQAHDAPIGKALNAHYVVLEDGSGYKGGELQKIVSADRRELVCHVS